MPGTTYSWHGMVSDGRSMSDYPQVAVCLCHLPVVRSDWRSPWHHREPGEEIT
jgi:hypothetical protein